MVAQLHLVLLHPCGGGTVPVDLDDLHFAGVRQGDADGVAEALPAAHVDLAGPGGAREDVELTVQVEPLHEVLDVQQPRGLAGQRMNLVEVDLDHTGLALLDQDFRRLVHRLFDLAAVVRDAVALPDVPCHEGLGAVIHQLQARIAVEPVADREVDVATHPLRPPVRLEGHDLTHVDVAVLLSDLNTGLAGLLDFLELPHRSFLSLSPLREVSKCPPRTLAQGDPRYESAGE